MSVVAAGAYSSRWARLVPIAFITYSLAYVDRANYSVGSAGGLASDLHISGEANALLGALFFLGYFLFQIPAAWYTETRSAKRIMFWSLLLWGVLRRADRHDHQHLSALCGPLPARYGGERCAACHADLPEPLVHQPERSRTNTFLILGNPVTVLWMSIVSGYLVHAVGWRGMFIIEGAPRSSGPSSGCDWCEDEPSQAPWLDPRERENVERRLEDEQRRSSRCATTARRSARPAVIALAVQYFCWSIGVYGFVLWLPSMLKAAASLALSTVGWLSAVPYLVATATDDPGVALFRPRRPSQGVRLAVPHRRRRRLLPAPTCWAARTSGSAFVLLGPSPAARCTRHTGRSSPDAGTLPRNVAGGAIALINSCGALGSFVGSYLVGSLNGATGGPGASFVFMAVALLVSGVLTLDSAKPCTGCQPSNKRFSSLIRPLHTPINAKCVMNSRRHHFPRGSDRTRFLRFSWRMTAAEQVKCSTYSTRSKVSVDTICLPVKLDTSRRCLDCQLISAQLHKPDLIPANPIRSPRGNGIGVGRDGCRTPMQWDATANAGFSRVKPWLPLADDFLHENVRNVEADTASILSLYKALTRLRRNSPELIAGAWTNPWLPRTIC